MKIYKQTDRKILCSKGVYDNAWVMGIFAIALIAMMYLSLQYFTPMLMHYLPISESTAIWHSALRCIVFLIVVLVMNQVHLFMIHKLMTARIQDIDNQAIMLQVVIRFSHETTYDDGTKIPAVTADWYHKGMLLDIHSLITERDAIEFLGLPPAKDPIEKEMQLVYSVEKPYLYYLSQLL
jgi:hypothetical protein